MTARELKKLLERVLDDSVLIVSEYDGRYYNIKDLQYQKVHVEDDEDGNEDSEELVLVIL